MRTLSLVLLALLATPAVADKAPPPKKVPLKQPAIAPALAARLPDPGRLVSYKADNGFVVARIGKTGATELFRKEVGGTDMWLDGKTIAFLDSTEGDVTVEFIVDGVLDPKRRFSHKKAVWGFKKGEESQGITAYRVDKEVWAEACLEQEGGDEFCKKSVWMRADVAAPKPQRTKPAKAVRAYDVPPVAPPDIAAPAGHAAKIAKVKGDHGLECTSPKGKVSWQVTNDGGGGNFTPKKLHWVLATPPVFGAEGVEQNPVGWDSNRTQYFRACVGTDITGFAWVHDGGVWASTDRDKGIITVRVDDTPVILFEGDGLTVAPK